MDQEAAARELIRGYVTALHAVEEAVKAAIPSLDGLMDVIGLVRSRRIERSGRIGPYLYKVHGTGCRFIGRDGVEVDVDFTTEGQAVFDLWRLRRHGRSLPTPVDLADQDLRSAARSLRPWLTEVPPGWFGVTG